MGMRTTIPNYELVAQIGESPQAIIYKAYNKKDSSHLVVLKVLKGSFLSDFKKSQFRQKIEQLRVLNDPTLITPISFDSRDEICFITQEFFDGVTLNKFVEEHGQLGLKDFFSIACGLAKALDVIHEAGIIHGGLKPHNILINPKTLDIRLIDFISSFDVRDVSHFIYDPSYIHETLCYTSPEQTGRINYRVGFPSDLYSLGIVFYMLLTARLPFSSLDPLEVIHSHLAEEAKEVYQIDSSRPRVLSNIIAKLMRKQPEKRYQSSSSLLADLVRCRDEYANMGSIVDFPLDTNVYSHRVTFISKMVGRDVEAKTILDEYELVAQGKFNSVFISGLSGIGKTRLIQELQKPIVKHRGYFTSGKFDVYQKNIPYSSLIQALRNLMRTFLTESDDRVESWKIKIMNVVGGNGKVLTDVIPELEIILGSQPPVPILPPVESLNRFHDVFDRFLTSIATEENPLVLFIDDLQWCDTASFDFFNNIFANHKNHPYLFFIGAYRHNEVELGHPLVKLMRNARAGHVPLKEIMLGPLKAENCHEMVSYILDSPLSQTRALADFISYLSEGNPLFISESLSYLHNENLLFLDAERQWQWDIEKVRQSSMPNTVVALFASKIKSLPVDSIKLLEYCACMGNTFSPTEIASIWEMNLTQVFKELKPALGLGLLLEHKGQIQFIHDKVQEASLSAITEERRRKIHWEVGTHLYEAALKTLKDIISVENLFAIVAHLNMGLVKNPDPAVAYLISDLNFFAGNKALDSLATDAANEYFKLSRDLLPEDCWTVHRYERTFKIYQNLAKTELMCGKYENSERILNELLTHANTDLDKAECLAEQTTSLSSIGNFKMAIETANRGLNYFNKAIPNDPDEANRKRNEIMAEIQAKGIDVWDTILNMPFTYDRKSKVELKFYSELIPDLYMSGMVPQLYLSAAQSTQHCLAGGMDESVIYSFSIMGLQLGEQELFEQAFKYEDLARNLSAKYPNTFGATRGMNGIVWCNAHSRDHPGVIVEYCLKSIQSGKNCGDLYNAGLSYGPLMWNLQIQGADLSTIEEYAKECLQFSNRYHLSFSVGLAEAMEAGWILPMKKNNSHSSISDKIRLWESTNHVASAGSYYVHRALSHYYFGEYEDAQECLEQVRKYLSGLTDNVLKRQWHVFLVLNALKLFERGKLFATKDDLQKMINPLIKKIETWANLGPLLIPYLSFVYAELERVTGDFREARSLYLDAIDHAHQQKYTFLEGYANESLGILLRDVGVRAEGIYFTEALRLYKKCHAERKSFDLIEKYPEYFEEQPASNPSVPTSPISGIDIAYFMKFALAISAEVDQEALLKKIMNVVIECSGAQQGYLLMEDDGDLIVRAGCKVAEREVPQLLNQKLDDNANICKAIARYVHRTQERVILNDACEAGPFLENNEVQEMQLRSVLCLPVIKQSKLLGILYLENRLSSSVFTPEKIQMTELLTSQAAISIENARLVIDIKRLNESLRERTLVLETKSQALLRSNQDLEQFAYAASHDLQEPLRMVVSFLELLTQKHSDNLGEEARKFIWMAVDGATRMRRMIYDLLAFSRIQSRQTTFGQVNLNEVIQDILSNLKVSIQETRAEIKYESLPTIYGDKEQLTSLFQNLVGNAMKFKKDSETPRIIIGKIIEKEPCTHLFVQDNGIGIDSKYFQKLFLIFHRLNTSQKYPGTGIGLALCKKIVERHNGRIWIDSTPGQGSTFHISIPDNKGN